MEDTGHFTILVCERTNRRRFVEFRISAMFNNEEIAYAAEKVFQTTVQEFETKLMTGLIKNELVFDKYKIRDGKRYSLTQSLETDGGAEKVGKERLPLLRSSLDTMITITA